MNYKGCAETTFFSETEISAEKESFGLQYLSDIKIHDMKFDGWNLVLYLFIITIAETDFRFRWCRNLGMQCRNFVTSLKIVSI